jgi:hypothetical protein
MADVLSPWSKEGPAPTQGNRATCGGCEYPPKELPYSPPVGPKGQMHNSVGLGGTNHGNAVNQGKH